MSKALLLVLLGALLVVVPMWLSRMQGSGAGKLRDGVQVAMRQSDPTMRNFFSGLRIGIEIAGAILIAIGVWRLFGLMGS